MLIIIPWLCFALIFLFIRFKLGEHYDLSVWRTSYLLASIVWGVLLTLLTEFLSFLNLLTFHWVLGSWIVLGLASAFICFVLLSKKKLLLHFPIPKLSGLEVISLLGVVFIVATVFLTALIAPPNTWDSMTYHMSRISHWVQNHNVGHYPTHILRQLYLQPGAEFMMMHLQILSGGDRFANSIQWLSMIGSLMGVSLIAKQLGANLSGQLFAVVICSTIPMGILQASNTKNDYVVSFWLVCFVYFLMLLRKEPRWIFSFATGASLGLAFLTKATAYIYAFPFFLWFVFSGFKRYQWKLWKPLLAIAIIALSINLGHYLRNFDLFGHPLGGAEGFETTTNSAFSVPLLTSNIIRNISLHIGTPLWLVNLVTYRVIDLLHTIIGIPIHDPRITFASQRFGIPSSFHETVAGNLVHLALITASIILLLSTKSKEDRDLMNYCIAVTTAFVLFALYLRWQAWGSRLHLPLFVLWSPFVATVMNRIDYPLKRNQVAIILCVVFLIIIAGVFLHDSLVSAVSKGAHIGFLDKMIGREVASVAKHYSETFLPMENVLKMFLGISICFLFGLLFIYPFTWKMENLICLVLILASLPWVFHNESKKLMTKENIFTMGRIDQYFSEFPYMKNAYLRAIDFIKSKECSEIGIILDESTHAPEYPLFVLLQKSGIPRFRIEHINVTNVSSAKLSVYPFSEFKPCAIISVSAEQKDQIIMKKVVYTKEWFYGPMGVFMKQ